MVFETCSTRLDYTARRWINTAATKHDGISGTLDQVAPSLSKLLEHLELQYTWPYLNNANTDRYTWVHPANAIIQTELFLISPFANVSYWTHLTVPDRIYA